MTVIVLHVVIVINSREEICSCTWNSSGRLRPNHPFACLGDALELLQGEMVRAMLQTTLNEIYSIQCSFLHRLTLEGS